MYSVLQNDNSNSTCASCVCTVMLNLRLYFKGTTCITVLRDREFPKRQNDIPKLKMVLDLTYGKWFFSFTTRL